MSVLAVLVLFAEIPAPAVALAHVHVSDVLTIRIQTDGDALRTQLVLVVFVIPGLHAGYRDLLLAYRLRHMDVSYIEAIDDGLILRHLILFYGIGDFSAILIVLLVFSEVPAPVILFAHIRVTDVLAIRIEPDGDALRTQPVLIISVIPGLMAFDADHVRFRYWCHCYIRNRRYRYIRYRCHCYIRHRCHGYIWNRCYRYIRYRRHG